MNTKHLGHAQFHGQRGSAIGRMRSGEYLKIGKIYQIAEIETPVKNGRTYISLVGEEPWAHEAAHFHFDSEGSKNVHAHGHTAPEITTENTNMNTTETLDKLYLEYSNLTEARTQKEIELEERVAGLIGDVRSRDQEIHLLKLEASIARDLQKEVEHWKGVAEGNTRAFRDGETSFAVVDRKCNALREELEMRDKVICELKRDRNLREQEELADVAYQSDTGAYPDTTMPLRREIAELTEHRKALMKSNDELSGAVARQFVEIQELRDRAELGKEIVYVHKDCPCLPDPLISGNPFANRPTTTLP